MMPKIGAHESVSGGLHLAFERIEQVGGEALQIFTRNQRQWNPAPLSSREIADFSLAWNNHSGMEVVSHGSYLINLASGKLELQEKSVQAFVLELERCHQLGVEKVVLHPGSHGGDGLEKGIERFVEGLDRAFTLARSDSRVLIETTAGQGTGIGATFEELAEIRKLSKNSKRIGVCVDTCHIFAAGYDIRCRETYEQTMRQLDAIVGLKQVEFFHLNDSKKDLGSRVDRHTHIGEGHIGLDGFRCLVNDVRFAECSMALETPKGKDLEEDRANLRLLRSLSFGGE